MKRPSRRQVLIASGIAAGALLLVLITSALAFGPSMVRSRVMRESAARGLAVTVGRIDVGFLRAELFDLDVRAELMPSASVSVKRVSVELGWGLDLRAIHAEGGSVRLRGERDEIERQLTAYRARYRAREGARVRGRSGTSWNAEGFEVTWNPGRAGRRLHATGVSVSSSGAGTSIAVGEGELEFDRASARIRELALELEVDGGARHVKYLDAASLLLVVDIGSDESGSPGKDSRPRVSSVGAVPSEKREHSALSPVLLGEALWPVDYARSASVERTLRSLRTAASSALPVGGSLTIDDVTAEIRSGKDVLHLGPSAFNLRRDARAVVVELAPLDTRGTPLKLDLTLPMESGGLALRVAGGPISLGTLGVRENDFGLQHVERTTLTAAGDLNLSSDATSLDLLGKLRFVDLSLKSAAIGHEPLTGIEFSLSGHWVVASDGTRITASDVAFELGDIRLAGGGRLERAPGSARLSIAGELPLTACQALMDGVPRGLLSSVKGTKLSGTFAGKAAIELDTRRPDDVKLEVSGENGCHIAAIPEAISPARFRSIWRRSVQGADGAEVEIESGPGSAEWTPYEAISPNLETSVLISEDGRFFRHHGFDEEAIANSLRDNLKAGRFVRGASTISMQLAKNLYLAREKTLSRKLEEAILTQLLEQELPKQALMELYLNVIEFGPGVYGARAGARHYFGVRPAELSLGQALFLGSILPNPKRNYFDANGVLEPGWADYLRKLMKIALKIHRITEADYELGMLEEVRLSTSTAPATSGPGDEPGARPTAPMDPPTVPMQQPEGPGP
jgi:hypothetical protein